MRHQEQFLLKLKKHLKKQYNLNVADASKNSLYSTLWFLISKQANEMIGDICIVGEPK